jgi:ketosteroid isomerase-like protein
MNVYERNVAITEAAFEAFNRRDAQEFARYMRADFEIRPLFTGQLAGAVYYGHQGIREWFADTDEQFAGIRAENLEYRDAGDQLVVLAMLRGRGRGSGVSVETPMGMVVELDENGMARRAITFASHAEALAHAGLEG